MQFQLEFQEAYFESVPASPTAYGPQVARLRLNSLFSLFSANIMDLRDQKVFSSVFHGGSGGVPN